MMLRTALHEIAVCLIGFVSVALFVSAPVVLILLADGVRRLLYSYP